MFYSDQTIDDVRQANNIVDVVSARVHLVKKGANYFGLCPFHNEKTPSFSVNPDRQIYYCFSCNKGGDVLKFVMETERLTFPETVQRLADRANIILPESSDAAYNKNLAAAKERKSRHFAMHAEAADFWRRSLMSGAGAAARAYLQRRMLRADTISRFGLGYAGGDWGALNTHLKSKGYKDEEQLENGLVLKNRNAVYYDRFRDRIMYPIHDAAGRVMAFGGRALGADGAKYMNSPETPYYSKGKNLYGLNFAKSTKEKYMIIVEGYMDLISLAANGIDNVVAPLGTALTETQVQLLKRYTDDAVVAFDSDAAGQAAALRSLDMLEKQGFRVRVLTIPDGKDPDDFIKANGAGAFRDIVREAVPLMDYRIASIRKKFPGGGAENDVRFLKEAVRALARVDDAMEREIYAAKIASQYSISENAIKAEIEKTLFGGGRRGASSARGAAGNNAGNVAAFYRGAHGAAGDVAPIRADAYGAAKNSAPPYGNMPDPAGTGAPASGDAHATDKNEPPQNHRQPEDELFIIALLAVDNSLWDIVADRLKPEYIDSQNAGQALAYACERASQGKAVSAGELMWYLSSEESDKLARIVADGCHCEDNRRAMEQKIKEIVKKRNRRSVINITRALETENLSEDDAARLRSQLNSYAKKA